MSLNYGVNIIERHFTINKKSSSPDVKFSIGVDELKNLKKFTISYKIVNDGKKSQQFLKNQAKYLGDQYSQLKILKKMTFFHQKI